MDNERSMLDSQLQSDIQQVDMDEKSFEEDNIYQEEEEIQDQDKMDENFDFSQLNQINQDFKGQGSQNAFQPEFNEEEFAAIVESISFGKTVSHKKLQF